MCTLSEGLYQEGIRVGELRGKQRGIAIGEKNGINKVLSDLAKPFIELGLSKEEIFEKLNLPNEYKESFNLMFDKTVIKN